MIHFESDYIAGAHPDIIKRLTETNLEPLSGYGTDRYCDSAKAKIAARCGNPDYQVEFISGGTQTNAIVIATMLHDWEGVISASTGHIFGHEAGAVEYTGNKVLPLPEHEGKICPDELSRFLADYHADGNKEHMVFPGMVYISHPTEYGTLYSKAELTALSEICHNYNIPLFMDGARLGYGIMSEQSDLTIEEVAELCDVFYIGGTKVGALCGEAVVFTKGNRPAHFMNSVKKRGALLAKGRLLGIQFDTLFTDDLYFDISKHAIKMAAILKKMLSDKGYEFFIDSPTNQQFVIVDNEKLTAFKDKLCYSFWEKYDDNRTVIRLATAWSTTEDDLKELDKLL